MYLNLQTCILWLHWTYRMSYTYLIYSSLVFVQSGLCELSSIKLSSIMTFNLGVTSNNWGIGRRANLQKGIMNNGH